jgi:hypothetical protein
METTQKIFPPLPQYAKLDFADLLQHLHDESPQVRAGVIAALGGKLPQSLEHVVLAIQDERNRNTAWFGFITVSWVGVVVLLENGDTKIHTLAKSIVHEWDTEERQHLLGWLKDFPEYAQMLDN